MLAHARENLPRQQRRPRNQRLFKTTVHRLCRWAQWTDTRRRLTQLRAVFADVTDATSLPNDFDQAAQWLLRHRRRANEGRLYRPQRHDCVVSEGNCIEAR